MATMRATGFGLQRLDIAELPTGPNTTPVWHRIPLIEQANFKLDVKDTELWGDNAFQGSFYHSAKGTITAKANQLALDIVERLTGVTASSDASGGETIFFGTSKELLPPRVMVRGIVPARVQDTQPGRLTVYWFNADVKTVWDGAMSFERGKIAEVNLAFNTYSSEVDEKGNAVSPSAGGSAVGRMAMSAD